MKKVFLGGTWSESSWRNRMVIYLNDEGLEWFNPIVDDWNEDAQAKERHERLVCDFCLYVITPKKTGDYSIAELVDDSNKRPDKTVAVFLRCDGDKTFDEAQWMSIVEVGKMVIQNGSCVFYDLESAAAHLGKKSRDC